MAKPQKIEALKLISLLLCVIVSRWVFIDKPPHIDDRSFLRYAEALKDGSAGLLGPTPIELRLRDGRENKVKISPVSPLYHFIVSPVLTFCRPILGFHLIVMGFTVATLLVVLAMARRFGEHPYLVAALYSFSPAFFPVSTNIFTDVPGLAFLLGSIWCLTRSPSDDSAMAAWGGALLGAVAVLVKYSNLVWLVVILIVVAYKYGIGRRLKVALLATALILGSWFGVIVCNVGFEELARAVATREIAKDSTDLKKYYHFAAAFGGLFLAPPFLAWLGWRKGRRDIFILFLSVVLTFPIWMFNEETMPIGAPNIGLFWLMTASGAYILASVAAQFIAGNSSSDALYRREEGWIALWLLSGAVIISLISPFGTVRYTLPLLPPALILIDRRVSDRLGAQGSSRLLALSLTVSVLLSFTLAALDYAQARGRREGAFQALRELSGTEGSLWYSGEHEFAYHVERKGRYLRKGDEPVSGDIIVWEVNDVIPEIHRRGLEDRGRIIFASWFPIPLRMFGFEDRAGYYSHGWGISPLVFGQGPIVEVRKYQVERDSGRLPRQP